MTGQVLGLRWALPRRSTAKCDAHSGSSSGGTRNELVERRRHSTPTCTPRTRRRSCSSSITRSFDSKPPVTGPRTTQNRLCSGHLASGTLTQRLPSTEKEERATRKGVKSVDRSTNLPVGLHVSCPQIYAFFDLLLTFSGLLSTTIYRHLRVGGRDFRPQPPAPARTVAPRHSGALIQLNPAACFLLNRNRNHAEARGHKARVRLPL